MIELIAMELNTPLDMIPKTNYPAYFDLGDYARPSSNNPIVKIPYTIYDKDGNRLEKGIYDVNITADYDFLLLTQSSKLYMKVPVIKVEDIKQQYEQTDKKKKKEKKLSKKEQKYKQSVEEYRKQSKLKASIEDSGNGYFILRYRNSRIKAVGYIPY